MAESEIETCSFCGLSSQSVEKMIKGNDKAYICNECIGLSLHILIKEDKRGDVKQLFDNIPAEVLLAFIKYIIFQLKIKGALSLDNIKNHLESLKVFDAELQKIDGETNAIRKCLGDSVCKERVIGIIDEISRLTEKKMALEIDRDALLKAITEQ